MDDGGYSDTFPSFTSLEIKPVSDHDSSSDDDDLVGIELNPGPPKKLKSKKKQPQQKKQVNSRSLQRVPVTDAAVPGRYPTPRNVTFGGSQMAGYMRCLNDPFNCPPVRPGVGCALPTGLFTCYSRQSMMQANGIGNFTLIFNCGRLQAPLMYSNGVSSPYTVSVQSPSTYPQYTAVTALYEKARLLASGIRIIPMQNSTADQGQISSALIPAVRVADVNNFGCITTSTCTFGYNEYPNFPETLMVPFKAGSTTFWRPQDPNSFAFREAPLTDSATASSSSTFTNETLQGIPFVVVGFSGLSTSQSQWVVEIISHFEGTIAAGNAGVIDLQRSPPVDDGTAIRAADAVFGVGNRTAKPGYYGSYNPSISSAGTTYPPVTKKKSGNGAWVKDLLSLGSSVVPMILPFL
jgi:hypothetical protein